MARIFISHSSSDTKFAEKLAKDLKDIGHAPWLDKWAISVGDSIPAKIQRGLSDSDYLVIILTPESIKGGWVDREWQSKFWDEVSANKTMVLPVLLEDCGIPQLLKSKRHADFRHKYLKGLVELVHAIDPVLVEQSGHTELPAVSAQDRRIVDLISELQKDSSSLSECMGSSPEIPVKAAA